MIYSHAALFSFLFHPVPEGQKDICFFLVSEINAFWQILRDEIRNMDIWTFKLLYLTLERSANGWRSVCTQLQTKRTVNVFICLFVYRLALFQI